MLTGEEDNVKEKRVLVFWILLTACLGKRERESERPSERERKRVILVTNPFVYIC